MIEIIETPKQDSIQYQVEGFVSSRSVILISKDKVLSTSTLPDELTLAAEYVECYQQALTRYQQHKQQEQQSTVTNLPAEAHSDDWVYKVDFNAARYFQTVTAAEILAVLNCDCCNDYPMDEVAQFASGYDTDVKELFGYIRLVNNKRTRNFMRFECSMEKQALLDWLQIHRSDVAMRLVETEDGYLLVDLPQPETLTAPLTIFDQ